MPDEFCQVAIRSGRRCHNRSIVSIDGVAHCKQHFQMAIRAVEDQLDEEGSDA